MRLKDLPPITGVNFLDRVREMLQTLKSQAVSVDELKKAGVIAVSGPPSAPVIEAGPVITPKPEVDLTPPPTPTGLMVTAGITRLIIECGTPTYTSGSGHDRTIIYGATYTSGPLPTFSNAVELKQFVGVVTDYVTNPATQWHIWIKWRSKDGVLSSSPAGGTNGVVATTGTVGTNDITNLAITNAKIGTAAVDTAKIADASIVTAKIADANVTTAKIADANITTAKIADANITTAKIANLAVGTAQIADASITNAKIFDLHASKITAGTITTDKLVANAATAAASYFQEYQKWDSTNIAINNESYVERDMTNGASLTTTGAPVKVIATANIFGYGNSALDAAAFLGTITILVDGVAQGVPAKNRCPTLLLTSGKSGEANVTAIVRLTSLAAGAHTFKLRIAGQFLASGGGGLFYTTSNISHYLEVFGSLIVEENKV